MIRFIIAAVLTGLLFGTMDGLINGNPYAVKLMECVFNDSLRKYLFLI